MLDVLKAVDKVIPLWELAVVFLAVLAIVVILVLWWAFGYNLVVVPENIPQAAQPAALALSLL